MPKTVTRTLATAALVIIATAPSTAGAQIYRSSSPAERGQSAALVLRPIPSTPPAGGFSWGDAAIGAGGMLVVLGFGSTVGVATRRRRVGRTAAA